MHILGSAGGYNHQHALWKLYQDGKLLLRDLTTREIEFMQQSMKKYRDQPMDLADASLMAIAEFGGPKDVFTLDSDFRIYRLSNGTALNIIP